MTKFQPLNALQSLLNERMQTFSAAFRQGSRQLFVDTNGGLVHAGEFGTYREEIVREYLRAFTPQRMAIDSGFIVNASGGISSQCDIVIYDMSVTPLLQSGNKQRFFPVESVCAIGEIKSVVSLAELKSALRKLALIKFFRESIYLPVYVHSIKEEGLRSQFSPNIDERDQIISFLICEKFSFNIRHSIKELLECYDEQLPNFPSNLRHNLVLSIDDGLLTYLHPSGSVFQFPNKLTEVYDYENSDTLKSVRMKPRRMVNRFIAPPPGSSEHIRHFSTLLHQALSTVSVLFPDMGQYIKSQEDVVFIDHDPV